jgi:hypothetical protein
MKLHAWLVVVEWLVGTSPSLNLVRAVGPRRDKESDHADDRQDGEHCRNYSGDVRCGGQLDFWAVRVECGPSIANDWIVTSITACHAVTRAEFSLQGTANAPILVDQEFEAEEIP